MDCKESIASSLASSAALPTLFFNSFPLGTLSKSSVSYPFPFPFRSCSSGLNFLAALLLCLVTVIEFSANCSAASANKSLKTLIESANNDLKLLLVNNKVKRSCNESFAAEISAEDGVGKEGLLASMLISTEA